MKKIAYVLLIVLLLVSMTVPAMAAGNKSVEQLNVALNKSEGFKSPGGE